MEYNTVLLRYMEYNTVLLRYMEYCTVLLNIRNAIQYYLI